MLENKAATSVDVTDVGQLTEMVRDIAVQICAEQPDMPEPHGLRDLDSFSIVQMLLEIENTTGHKILEKFETYAGGLEFADLAAFLVRSFAEDDADDPGAATQRPGDEVHG
jgi:hypothetical protein